MLAALALEKDPPALALQRALPLLQAALPPAQRLSLHQSLWRLWREVDEADRQRARTRLDGRLAACCAWMDTAWAAPATWQRLALAHLQPPGPRPAVLPWAPDYVLALLQHHGLDGDAAPAPALALALRARVALLPPTLDPAAAQDWMTRVMDTVEQGTLALPEGLLLLLDLAQRSDQDTLGAQALAQLLALDQAAVVPAELLLRWLQGSAPLVLREPLQSQWLQPRHLARPAWRAGLRHHLRRPAVLARLDALEAALQALAPQAGGPAEPVPDGPAWRALQALDGCHALAEQGRLDEATARSMRATGALAPPALAALDRAVALHALDRADLAQALRHLARARATVDDPQARAWLAQLLATVLPADGPAARTGAALQAQLADGLADGVTDGSTGAPGTSQAGRPGDEPRLWLALADAADLPPALRPAAQAMAARGLEAGHLDARHDARHGQWHEAAAQWQALRDDPDHADEARRQLDGETLKDWLPRLRPGPGRPHLWTEPASGAANGELLVVLSCLDSRHRFTQVRALQQALPGHHLLHLNNPEFNWYSDTVFDELAALMQDHVLPRFGPERITCWFGSMGGHGALKLALAFGLRAVVFNPQIDLALWAAFRPRERPQLLAARRHASLADFAPAAWAHAPLYLAFGSGTADREALSVLIGLLRRQPDFQLVIEKFDDPVHAGLVKRIATDGIAQHVLAASQRLAALRHVSGTDAPWQPVAPTDEDAFWQRLDDAPRLKLELLRRGGALAWAPSQHCGTRG